MALRLDDRYLWLGFGVFFVAAAYGLRYAITDLLDLTQVEPVKLEEESEKDEKPENAIDLDTLRNLATSPNPNIAHAAKTFIIQRFIDDQEARAFHDAGLISNDTKVRRRAELANQYLTNFDAGDSHGDPGVGYEYALQARQRARRALGLSNPIDRDGGRRRRHHPGFPPGHSGDGDETEISTPESLPDLVRIEGLSHPVRQYPLDPVAGWTDIPRERTVSPSREDAREARRRRREAMVVHEDV